MRPCSGTAWCWCCRRRWARGCRGTAAAAWRPCCRSPPARACRPPRRRNRRSRGAVWGAGPRWRWKLKHVHHEDGQCWLEILSTDQGWMVLAGRQCFPQWRAPESWSSRRPRPEPLRRTWCLRHLRSWSRRCPPACWPECWGPPSRRQTETMDHSNQSLAREEDCYYERNNKTGEREELKRRVELIRRRWN